MDQGYTRRELMVARAASEIGDGDIAFVGMRLPLVAFALATATHAPNALGLFESGVIRDTPPQSRVITMCDQPNLDGALYAGSLSRVMNTLSAGKVDIGFVGGAQIDRYGNLNTTQINRDSALAVRLPGSGGACDIAAAARRLLVIMSHEPRRFVPRVDFRTSAGYGDGRGWRAATGLRPLESVTLITTRAVLRASEESDGFVLESLHPGEKAAEVVGDTPWEWPEAPQSAPETPVPDAAVLSTLRELDAGGFWTGDPPAAG